MAIRKRAILTTSIFLSTQNKLVRSTGTRTPSSAVGSRRPRPPVASISTLADEGVRGPQGGRGHPRSDIYLNAASRKSTAFPLSDGYSPFFSGYNLSSRMEKVVFTNGCFDILHP